MVKLNPFKVIKIVVVMASLTSRSGWNMAGWLT